MHELALPATIPEKKKWCKEKVWDDEAASKSINY